MNLGKHFDIGGPALQISVDDEYGNTIAYTTRKAIAIWKEDIDHYIMGEIVKMCKEHGFTDLYVLNRDFILAAIREKMEREV